MPRIGNTAWRVHSIIKYINYLLNIMIYNSMKIVLISEKLKVMNFF